MKRTWGVVLAGLFLGIAGAYAPGCGDDLSCGDGTTKVDGVCVANTPDLSTSNTGATCGPKTQLNSATGQCEVTAAACPQGYNLDPTNFNCVLPSLGDLVISAGLQQQYIHVARLNPSPPDGGTAYQALGTATGGVSVTGVADTELLFMAKAPFAAIGKNTANVWWSEGPPTSVGSYTDHQFTFGEWKGCKGSYAIYKNPPVPKAKGLNWYKEVVDVSGCPAGILFGIWNVFSRTDLNADRVLSTPAGGIPEGMITDSMGNGHFERDLDPATAFLQGSTINGIAHGSTVAVNVPDLATYPNATLVPHLVYQNQGQTNGNPTWCDAIDNLATHVLDGNTMPANEVCRRSQQNKIFLPGNGGVTTVVSHYAFAPVSGEEAYCNGTCKPVPLAMVQPY